MWLLSYKSRNKTKQATLKLRSSIQVLSVGNIRRADFEAAEGDNEMSTVIR